jgi:uncharacterized protein (DUF488 family)
LVVGSNPAEPTFESKFPIFPENPLKKSQVLPEASELLQFRDLLYILLGNKRRRQLELRQIDWAGYEKLFLELLAKRKAENLMLKSTLNKACFLCSEDKPNQCHRKIVAEYLKDKLGNIEITHI